MEVLSVEELSVEKPSVDVLSVEKLSVEYDVDESVKSDDIVVSVVDLEIIKFKKNH